MKKLCLLSLILLCIACPDPRRRSSKRIYMNLGGEPTTIHPINSSDGYASGIYGHSLESLLEMDPETREWKPRLAYKWKISGDKKVFDFWLRENVVFNDGTPFSAEDVVFSYQAIFDDRFMGAPKRSYYEGIEKVEAINEHHVRFTMKNKYFRNFEVSAGMSILSKKFYNNVENKKKAKKTVVGTGPYKIKEYNRGQNFILDRNPLWWGEGMDQFKNRYLIPEIFYRFVQEENIYLELLKKGDIDFSGFRPAAFVKKTNSEIWKERVVKVKTKNKTPKGYSFVAFNFKNPILKRKPVRKALSHLMNRDFMIDKFEFGLPELATGPTFVQSDYADPSVKPVPFDPKKALKILRNDGWRDSDQNGILDQVINGKKYELKLTLIDPLPDFMKYNTVFKEDAKKAGVHIDLKNVEWNSFIKLLDERKFQMVRLAWGGGSIEWDPKQIWHSDSSKNGGSNFISYYNPEVDRLIDKARLIFDRDKRIQILQKVYKLIAYDYPYIFFFNNKYTLYGHTKRVIKPKETFKYTIGTDYWKLQKAPSD